MKHIARKRFGQHFLTDGGIIDAIVRVIDPRPGQAMVEIGPGLAALTQPLVERLGHLTVIELDRDLAQRLRAHGQLTVVESDVLKVDFAIAEGVGRFKKHSKYHAENRATGSVEQVARGWKSTLQHFHADPLSPVGLRGCH